MGKTILDFEKPIYELEEKLFKRFPQTDDIEVSEEDNSVLNQEIETLLNDIEDLAEALEL